MKMDKTTYMAAIIHKLLEDIKAKEMDYGTNGVKVQLLLGWDEARILLDALEKDGKKPFINKPCISEGVCHEDKMNVLDKIRAEIEKLNPIDCGLIYSFGARDMKEDVLGIIDKYKAESEDGQNAGI